MAFKILCRVNHCCVIIKDLYVATYVIACISMLYAFHISFFVSFPVCIRIKTENENFIVRTPLAYVTTVLLVVSGLILFVSSFVLLVSTLRRRPIVEFYVLASFLAVSVLLIYILTSVVHITSSAYIHCPHHHSSWLWDLHHDYYVVEHMPTRIVTDMKTLKTHDDVINEEFIHLIGNSILCLVIFYFALVVNSYGRRFDETESLLSSPMPIDVFTMTEKSEKSSPNLSDRDENEIYDL